MRTVSYSCFGPAMRLICSRVALRTRALLPHMLDNLRVRVVSRYDNSSGR
jgi:hypothetical protein